MLVLMPSSVTQAQAIPAIRLTPAVRVAVAADESDPNAPPGQIVIRLDDDAWKYQDDGSKPAPTWRDPDFAEDDWKQGVAPFGYGDDGLTTEVAYGGDRENKHITTYFRRSFEWKKDDNIAGCSVRLMVDDGAVIYLNGKEVVRQNLPEGEVGASTKTRTAISGDDERLKWLFAFDASQLRDGKNTIAAEVHQCNSSSTDLAFSCELALLDKDQFAQWQELVANEQKRLAEVARREAEAAEVVDIAEANQPETNQYYFADGEVTYNMADGRTITQRSDAVQQISQSFPFIRFARAMSGDTIEKIALQHNYDPLLLYKTNRVAAGHVYREDEVVCLRWRHRVLKDETLESIAKLYSMDLSTLLELNGLMANDTIMENQILNVAGRYDHQIPATKQQGQGHLMLTVVMSQMNLRNSTYVPVGRGIQTHQVEEGDTLASLTEELKLTPNFLRRLNRLGDEEEIEPGDRIMTSFLVKLGEGVTFDDICFAHGLEIEDILEANDVATVEELSDRKSFHLPYPIQRAQNSRAVQVFEGGFF